MKQPMKREPFRVPIRELGDVGEHWQQKVMPDDALHYMPPNRAAWSTVRIALLVPESVVLMVAPLVCGRICSIQGLKAGFRERFFLLGMTEADMVTGQYEAKIVEAVAEVLAHCRPRPKVLLLCATCVDDLLGSDYETIARQLERQHGLLVRTIHLKPTAADGRRPSGLVTQEVTYDLLQRSRERDSSINTIGTYAPIEQSSELHEVLAAAGVEKVRHIAACSTLEEFQCMSRASLNLVARPAARLAVQHMERKLGIPYCYAPVAYALDSIAGTYDLLSDRLGAALATERYRSEAEAAIDTYRRQLGPLDLAVGSGVNAGPFELTRALTEYGFRVRYVFANAVLDYDVEHIEWLKQNAPDLVVFTDSHTSMASFLELGLQVDLAMGFDAGYYCSGAKTAPLLPDTQPYGYRGVVRLLEEMAAAMRSPKSHRQAMDESFILAWGDN